MRPFRLFIEYEKLHDPKAIYLTPFAAGATAQAQALPSSRNNTPSACCPQACSTKRGAPCRPSSPATHGKTTSASRKSAAQQSARLPRNILNQPSAFDSFPAIVALTAVAQVAPAQEIAALQRIQAARYADGQDIADYAILADLLREQGLQQATALLSNSRTHEQAQQRIAAGQALAQKLGANGVPQLVEHRAQDDRLLPREIWFQAA